MDTKLGYFEHATTRQLTMTNAHAYWIALELS